MKKLAPIIIVMVIGSGLLLYFASFIIASFLTPGWVTVILILSAVCVLGALIALIYTLISRLKEIDKEDERDDLSKY